MIKIVFFACVCDTNQLPKILLYTTFCRDSYFRTEILGEFDLMKIRYFSIFTLGELKSLGYSLAGLYS